MLCGETRDRDRDRDSDSKREREREREHLCKDIILKLSFAHTLRIL